jgi:hypothetical protein
MPGSGRADYSTPSGDIKTAVESVADCVDGAGSELDINHVASDIQLPVDIQNVLPFTAELVDGDGDHATAAGNREAELDKGGFLGYGYNCSNDTTAVVWTRYGSMDGTNWELLDTSGASQTYTSGDAIVYSFYRYIRITAAKSGAPGDLINIDMGAGL